jgi:tetratricopeptide (TPR) repeat protein
MKRLSILCIQLLFSSCYCLAETPLDSLKKRLTSYHLSDTARVNLLNQLGYEYWIVDPLQSELYGNEALLLADSLKYIKGKAFANRVVGVSHWARGHYDTALKYLFGGLTAYQELNDQQGIGSMYNNIGLVYLDQHSYELALEYFEQSLQKHRLFNNDREAGVLSNIGNTYLKMGNHAEAEKMYQTFLKKSLAAGRKYGIAESYSNLGELSMAKNKPQESLDFFFRSLEIREQIPDLEGISMCRYLIGKAYISLKQYEQAELHLKQGIQTSIQVSTRKWLTKIYSALKEIEVARSNYKQALAYQEEFAARKDSLFDEEKSRQIAEMQVRYQTLQQEQKLQLQQKQLEILQQESRIQLYLRNGLLAGLLLLGVIGYLVVSKQRLKIRNNKELLKKNKALAEADLEKARLQELKLTQELEYKNKELTSYTLNFIQKNELLEELKQNIQQLKRTQDKATVTKLNELNRMVEHSMNLDKDWEDFKRHFEEMHKDFFKTLKDNYPDITSNELKLCTLLKLNMNLKEASHVMGISPESVKTARYRLRKKFNLTRDENLIDHILELEKKAFEPSTKYTMIPSEQV